MITNSRLQELRATGIACQRRVDRNHANHLEKDYADLFQICLDNLPDQYVSQNGEKITDRTTGSHLFVLLGK